MLHRISCATANMVSGTASFPDLLGGQILGGEAGQLFFTGPLKTRVSWHVRGSPFERNNTFVLSLAKNTCWPARHGTSLALGTVQRKTIAFGVRSLMVQPPSVVTSAVAAATSSNSAVVVHSSLRLGALFRRGSLLQMKHLARLMYRQKTTEFRSCCRSIKKVCYSVETIKSNVID